MPAHGVSTSPWMTPEEAADYLRVSRATLYRMCGAKVIPFHELPGSKRRRFRRDELDAAVRGSPNTPGGGS